MSEAVVVEMGDTCSSLGGCRGKSVRTSPCAEKQKAKCTNRVPGRVSLLGGCVWRREKAYAACVSTHERRVHVGAEGSIGGLSREESMESNRWRPWTGRQCAV